MNPFRSLYKTWITGLLYCLAVLGYIFYGILLTLRTVQTNKAILILAVVVLLACVGSLFLLVPIGMPGDPVELSIGPGSSVRSVTVLLKENEVVPSARALEYWIRLRGQEKTIQAGKHVFYQNEGVFSAAERLRHSIPVDVKVTVQEGLTVEQVGGVLAPLFEFDSASFVNYCYTPSTAKRYDIEAPTLEGYLFPDTYRFHPGSTIEEIVERMVGQFREAFDELNVMSSPIHLSEREFVTMASIVEKEAVLDSERTRISGVFHNRLKRGMTLGADPTVRYVHRKFSGPLRVSELKNQSPYNTRVHAGLPPGPICSPGKKALRAAVFPMETDDLFFVAKWDGSGAHDFSRTNAEHVRKKHMIRAENEQRIRNMTKEQE